MDNRIKHIRNHFGLTQQQFADRLGIKRGAVANYELGRNVPIDAVISLICREFGVDETWLRTGEGKPFRHDPLKEQVAAFANELMRDEPESFRLGFVASLKMIPPQGWAHLEQFIRSLVDVSHQQAEEQKPAPKSNIVKMAGRDGSYQELELTDQQLADLKQRIDSLPDVPEDL